MLNIPKDYDDFLYWFKNITEDYWQREATGAKWIGLTDEQIDAVEEKHAIKFTEEHRAFLRVLHTIDKKEEVENIEELNGEEITTIEERSYFYNWLTDDILIKKYLTWPYETILHDVISSTWLKSWGEKPGSIEEKKAVFTKWYGNAPKLLPLRHHTYLVNDATLERRPVLSVYGADVIIKGWSLKAYLISEFSNALGFIEMVYDKEDKVYYPQFKENILRDYGEYFQFKLYYPIPYWDEMILYYNWQFHKV